MSGTTVIYARGLEIDLARELSTRLELQRTLFTQDPFETTVGAGPRRWDLAPGEITITPQRATNVDFSNGYMRIDQMTTA